MKRIYKKWIVTNEATGEVLFEGRKQDCIKFIYPLYVYGHRFNLGLYRTSENLN